MDDLENFGSLTKGHLERERLKHEDLNKIEEKKNTENDLKQLVDK